MVNKTWNNYLQEDYIWKEKLKEYQLEQEKPMEYSSYKAFFKEMTDQRWQESRFVQLFDDKKTVGTPIKYTYILARERQTISKGKKTWTIKAAKCVYLGVGFLDRNHVEDGIFDKEYHLKKGTFLHYHSGTRYMNGKTLRPGETRFQEGDEITVHLNVEEQIALLYINNLLAMVAKDVSKEGRYQFCPILQNEAKVRFVPPKLIGEKEYSEAKQLFETQEGLSNPSKLKIFNWNPTKIESETQFPPKQKCVIN